MNATPDPLADWRAFVCEENLSPEITEVAMGIADAAIGKRDSLDLVNGAIGYEFREVMEAMNTLVKLNLMFYDQGKASARFSILLPEEKTPPHVEGDRVFDSAEYRRIHGDWEEAPHGVRRRTDETLLYHYYDAHDVLLYVGITNSLPRRQTSHEGRSTWMDFAARSTLKRFPTRASATAVEMVSIRHRAPLFNIEHNDRPDRVRRIVDYLIDRDRRDLLVPLISRG